jgi:arsenite methyltransferase
VTDERFTPRRIDWNDPALADAFDELPLWSAPFGLALLDAVELRPGIAAVDVGCGTGFPAIELAERLGAEAIVHGVDTSEAALARARRKAAILGVRNAVFHRTGAEALPFEDGAIDLVVSNNGFNNVADPDGALAECARVARPGAQLVYAYNLPGSLGELYDALRALFAERGLADERRALEAHVFEKRKPLDFAVAQLERAGFFVATASEHAFRLRFADSAALLGHAFVRLAFLPHWLEIVAPPLREPVFAEIARRLDAGAAGRGLALTIPFACLDCRRAP